MVKGGAKFGHAWILLTSVFALHVIDEAVFDFLPFYNSFVTNAKEKLSFFPFPNFTFALWLSGLIAVIIILFVLSKFAYRITGWIIKVSVIYGIIMFINGILHFVASVYFSKPIGGVYSSPLLIIGSIYLLWHAVKELKRSKNDYKTSGQRTGY
ncbi:MAG: hypothetical protein JSV24_08390 [Bacteroidales bacterium]|nr:MAG: hypothetical protein JSV24_08390 [Bacteroidales bacterium]